MLRRVSKWLVFKCLYPFLYHIFSLRRVRKKVIFVENHQDALSDNFKLIYQRIQGMDYKINIHYLQIAFSGWAKVIIRSCKLIIDMATAECIFVDESNSLFGAFILRKETKLIQVWHACGAFKKWGNSVSDKSFGDDEKNLLKYPGHRNYTLVPVSGVEVCEAYEEAFGISPDSDIVRPLGVSRTDVYFNEQNNINAHNKLHNLISETTSKRVILYAPTFRGNIRQAKAPLMPDIKELFEKFDKDYILLIKQHPFIKEKMHIPDEFSRFCIEISDELSMDELLFAADICITDYSSIVFEYSLLNKPILFFAYDLDEYYDERGFYYPYETFVPGPIARTNEELTDYIENIDKFDFERLKEFKDKYMGGCDGHSTERILKEVFGG